MKAAESLAIRPELIDRDDYGRLAEFDALFIRETTYVNHHTYRFARRAAERRTGGHRRSRTRFCAAPTRCTWPS